MLASLPVATIDAGDPPLSDQCTTEGSPALAGYEIDSGSLRWVNCAGGAARRSVAAATGQIVYMAEQLADPTTGEPGTPHLVAIDVTDGESLWQIDVGLVPTGPFIGSGVAVVGLEDAQGRATVGFDPISGSVLWRSPIEDAAPIATTDTVVILQSAESDSAGFSALDRATGAELWSTDVAIPPGYAGGFFGASVDGDMVLVLPGPVALDANSGNELWRLDSGDLGPVSDGVMVSGGQDEPTNGTDAATGELLWTMPGSPPYDDVWAIGDGAVYVVDTVTSEVVAYELADGSVRWRQPWDGVRYSWPYYVSGDTMFAMWTNLDAMSTADGTNRWATTYPSQEFPRMTGTFANDNAVFVAFSTVASGGD